MYFPTEFWSELLKNTAVVIWKLSNEKVKGQDAIGILLKFLKMLFGRKSRWLQLMISKINDIYLYFRLIDNEFCEGKNFNNTFKKWQRQRSIRRKSRQTNYGDAKSPWQVSWLLNTVYINVSWVMGFFNLWVQNQLEFIKKRKGLQGNYCTLWIDITPGTSNWWLLSFQSLFSMSIVLII